MIDDRPLGTIEQVELAAKKCGVAEWHLDEVFAFDAPQTDERHLSFKVASLPHEEVDDPNGRTWNRTKRVERIEACLLNSFDEQGVRVPMLGAARSVSCQGSACDGFERQPQ
ncbi:hypothetical protein [Novosphingobium aquimarinum]|uniref:hypothetical protein n=1 Tax=Novosphingobium aquimarinum TaxID=2682494 RepID=UPI0012EC1C1F|nr:hypothetical protein [Novosphingobium aquimarinum]